ncbi:MAG: methyltransferase domain-containing protein [Gammaproteobacteria bacterium]|nr:methyltransferase domain-containing protein [Gammaproteobacteria bacterium]
MKTTDDAVKWNQIYKEKSDSAILPSPVLIENSHLLPDTGIALDLACGRGANALFLAEHGLDTQAWDISDVAIETLQRKASGTHRNLHCQVRDIINMPPEPASLDVIVVSRFLERCIVPNLIAALRHGGLIFYQTFINDQVSQSGPRNPDYRLKNNELLHLFQDMRILVYREEGSVGSVSQGFRNEAMLIASIS